MSEHDAQDFLCDEKKMPFSILLQKYRLFFMHYTIEISQKLVMEFHDARVSLFDIAAGQFLSDCCFHGIHT